MAAIVQDYDAIVVGAGFGGLHMLYVLREMGLKTLLIEAGDDVGGTWYWNRYPGARCDVESVVYSFSFAPELDNEWRWSERYATQPEILAYLKFAADRLDLRKDIYFGARVEKAVFNEADARWTLTTDQDFKVTARFCVMASGPLSASRMPDIPGIDQFKGEIYHTGQWPESKVDFAGKRVVVVGTGSSGTQLIPVVAPQAERLFVFMRTPNYSVPAKNAPLSDAQYQDWLERKDIIRARIRSGEITSSGDCFIDEDLLATRTKPAAHFTSEAQQDIMERRWNMGGALLAGSFQDVMLDDDVNRRVGAFVETKIAEIVNDTATAELLTPKGYPFGAKRLCVDTDFYETFNRDNVELVDVKAAPIERMTETGLATGGREIQLDLIVFATGFDAMTGALGRIEIKGRAGTSLSEIWADGPANYLGLAVAGFPNLFMIAGPGSPSVLSNVVMSNEFQVDFIAGLISHIKKSGYKSVEATEADQSAWVSHVNAVAAATLLMKANSWYLGANIPGKPRVFLPYAGGVVAYREKCNEVAASEYAGFRFSRLNTELHNTTDFVQE